MTTEREAEGAVPSPFRRIGADIAGTASEILECCNRLVRNLIAGAPGNP